MVRTLKTAVNLLDVIHLSVHYLYLLRAKLTLATLSPYGKVDIGCQVFLFLVAASLFTSVVANTLLHHISFMPVLTYKVRNS